MNAINNVVQKVFVLGIAVCFMFVAIYVPQNWNKVNEAEAAFATKAGQIMINATNVLQLAQDRITSAATLAIQWFQSSIWTKEWILDGIGWWIAKMILSQVSRQIVIWINSGFQGSPAFVQDLEGFALRMADQAAGLYLANLGSPLLTQFVCAPFRLNLQIAISAGYNYGRSMFPYGASRCTLTQAMQNIDRFTDGSFMYGGWNAWYQISAQPLTYTPYGEYLAAQNQLALRANVSIRNENSYLGFGNGFFSNKFCDVVATAAVPRERCMVSTPGHVISENLNFHLTAGSRSLIAADEINEILGALLGQLAQTAITGAHGLLGMSHNTGYTLPRGVDDMVNEQVQSSDTLQADYLTGLDAQIAREERFRDAIQEIIPMLEAINNTASLAEAERARILLDETNNNLTVLYRIRTDLINNTRPLDVLLSEYYSLRNLHSDSQIAADLETWNNHFVVIYTAYKSAVDDGLYEIGEFRPRLVLYEQTHNGQYADEARDEIELIDDVYQPALEADRLALEQIAADWNNPAIPKIDVVNDFIDVRDGIIAPPPLITQEDVDRKTKQWDDILNQP